ncbi:putative gustatory receptor clone PTE03 [Xenopus laevis]|uniref:G-protein coupled receptors family 1 profile domain-containing protein n=2 Tax=Xenopus laevis TaxID=8355 RepID=A0A974HWV8_XENLA|nr:putative gustatory receptor clone PTE03 [Xenopus laevis]OCT93407.1 hypothetical protein XELAEV_18016476mg [Xenopus laevis]
MPNSTYSHPSVLALSFGQMTEVKYLYGAIVFLIFLMIAVSSSTVIGTIILHRTLHEPMYIFIAALCMNGLYGSICFFPALFVNLVSQIQTISYISCLIQIFGIHTYIGCEITVLAAMAFDRYVCICNPLRYNSLMTSSNVFKLIGAAWLYIIIIITIHVILTIRLPLCGSVIEKIYCDNWSVVRLSCIDTTLNNIFGLLITSVTSLLPGCIFISYVKILMVCTKSSKDVRAKALQTCTPHLVSLTYFATNILCEILLLRFPVNTMPYELKIIISVQAYVLAPLLNPLMYGLKMREIRVKIGHIFYIKKS